MTAIEADGKPFDPTVHSAVLTEEAEDVAEPVVGEDLQKGFRLHDRLLRPAMVKVLVPTRAEGPRSSASISGRRIRASPISPGGKPAVIPNLEGAMTTPSVVAFAAAGETLVGTMALRQAVTNPRADGLRRQAPDRPEIRGPRRPGQARKRLPYKLAAAPNGDVVIDAAGRMITPQEVSALVLAYLKKCAEVLSRRRRSGDAVITVPAHFGEPQRQATKDAAVIAGLERPPGHQRADGGQPRLRA